MSHYENERAFSDRFLPDIQAIIGQALAHSDNKEDIRHNTDLLYSPDEILPTTDPYGRRWGLRVRKYKFIQYSDEFTITYEHTAEGIDPHNAEFWKIMKGWGDYFFYSFCDESKTYIAKWLIGDYSAFRRFVNRLVNYGTHLKYTDYDHALKKYIRYNPASQVLFLTFKKYEIPNFVIEDSNNGSWRLEDKKIWTRINPIGSA